MAKEAQPKRNGARSAGYIRANFKSVPCIKKYPVETAILRVAL